MINDTTGISEGERKLIEDRTSDATNKIKFVYPERKTGDENKEPSPFKIYENRFCSECQDYRGCIGLIDSMAVYTDTQDIIKPGYEALDSTTKAMINGAMKGLTNMAFTMRFKLILDCSNLRNYINKIK